MAKQPLAPVTSSARIIPFPRCARTPRPATPPIGYGNPDWEAGFGYACTLFKQLQDFRQKEAEKSA